MRPTRITAAPPRALGLRKPGRFPRAPSLPGPRPSGEHGGGGVGRKDGASPPSPCPLGDPSCRDARPRAPARGDFGPLSWNIAGAAFPRSPGRPPDADAGPRGRGTPSVKVIWTRGSRCSCTARLGPWTQPFPPPAATPAPPGGGGRQEAAGCCLSHRRAGVPPPPRHVSVVPGRPPALRAPRRLSPHRNSLRLPGPLEARGATLSAAAAPGLLLCFRGNPSDGKEPGPQSVGEMGLRGNPGRPLECLLETEKNGTPPGSRAARQPSAPLLPTPRGVTQVPAAPAGGRTPRNPPPPSSPCPGPQPRPHGRQGAAGEQRPLPPRASSRPRGHRLSTVPSSRRRAACR